MIGITAPYIFKIFGCGNMRSRACWMSDDTLPEGMRYACMASLFHFEYERRFRHNVTHWARQYEYPWALYNTPRVSDGSMRILDAGTGDGTFLPYIQHYCDRGVAVGIDIILPDKQYLLNAGIDLFRAEFQHIPFVDNTFDVVYCISALEHMTPPYHNVVKEFLRVLKPTGVLLTTIEVGDMGVPNTALWTTAMEPFGVIHIDGDTAIQTNGTRVVLIITLK
jgi:ubiquinone/menaquinone biosynthesis C-methylase UbiE